MMQNSSATTEQITAWDKGAVSEFATGQADVLVLNREPLENLGPIVETGRVHEFVAPVSRQTVGFEVRSGLGELRMKSPELTTDIISLASSFLDQFGLQEARLRIELTRTQSCPKFHCDNVHVRLVTTYVGPGTEYQYSGDTQIHSVSPGGLIFLKGHKNAGCRDTVHHRSPEVSADQRRLCVAIDF